MDTNVNHQYFYKESWKLLHFDEFVKEIINNGLYSWEELFFLKGVHSLARTECFRDKNFNGEKHTGFPKSLNKRFKGYESLLVYDKEYFNIIHQIGYSLKESARTFHEGNGIVIHDSGMMWDEHSFFIINCYFRRMGICRFEFELGELDYADDSAIIKAKVIFQGLDCSLFEPSFSRYPRIYLAVLKDGNLVNTMEEFDPSMTKNYIENMFRANLLDCIHKHEAEGMPEPWFGIKLQMDANIFIYHFKELYTKMKSDAERLNQNFDLSQHEWNVMIDQITNKVLGELRNKKKNREQIGS